MVEIDVGSNLFQSGDFLLSWHGFFSFIAVATAVYLVGRWAPLRGVNPDVIYSMAIWAILGGIIGARVVHVVDNWAFYQDNPGRIIAIWAGGIGLWGGILGGLAGGLTYAVVTRSPIGVIADLVAPAMLTVQTIGRIGDIVNGEHCARVADHIFGFVWTNPNSDAGICENGVGVAVQPVIAMEITWNLLALLVIWNLRGRLRPDGMIYVLYLALYSLGRFMITFLREDRVWAIGLQEAQFIALVVLAVAVPWLAIKARVAWNAPALEGPPPEVTPRGSRAERRRRRRG